METPIDFYRFTQIYSFCDRKNDKIYGNFSKGSQNNSFYSFLGHFTAIYVYIYIHGIYGRKSKSIYGFTAVKLAWRAFVEADIGQRRHLSKRTLVKADICRSGHLLKKTFGEADIRRSGHSSKQTFVNSKQTCPQIWPANGLKLTHVFGIWVVSINIFLFTAVNLR